MTSMQKVMGDYKSIKFEPSERFRWSPEDKIVFYNSSSDNASWSLLHEIGHVLCGHRNYVSDIGLLKMEVEAWQKAQELSPKYSIRIDKNHIEKCLDSYRDWLYRRSSCPRCTQAGIEKQTGSYSCINCKNKWTVSVERFCRVYRKTVTE